MQVQLETLSNLERQMSIALPMSDVESQVTERLKRIARKAKIPGFRPGKAPLKIISANYSSEVQEEVLNEAIHRSFSSAIAEKGLTVAGMPRFDAQEAQDEAGQFKFKVVFEVYPEVVIGDMSAVTIEKPVLQVTEQEVNNTIEILRGQRASYNHVERAAADADRVIIDFKGSIDGEEFSGGSAENLSLILGKKQMISEFENGVCGVKEGESKLVNVTFPDDYHEKSVAGKNAVFNITVKNVSEPVLPEIDSEFAKALGIVDGDVSKMREEIRKNVEREVKRRLSVRTKENVMQALLDVTKLDLPKSLVVEEMNRLADEMRQNLTQRGFQAKNLELPMEGFRKQAERRVALGLILSELVSSNKLVAEPERVKEMLIEHAESYEQPDEVIKWYYSDKKNLAGPTTMALEESVVEFILNKAKIEEKTVSFDDLMGANA